MQPIQANQTGTSAADMLNSRAARGEGSDFEAFLAESRDAMNALRSLRTTMQKAQSAAEDAATAQKDEPDGQTEETADTAAALLNAFVMPLRTGPAESKAAPPDAVATDASQDSAQAASAQEPVVSILEGLQTPLADEADRPEQTVSPDSGQNNTDMNLPVSASTETAVPTDTPVPAEAAAPVVQTEGQARMPQTQESPELSTATDSEAVPASPVDDNPCPLENENEPFAQDSQPKTAGKNDDGELPSASREKDKPAPGQDAAEAARAFPVQQTVDITPEKIRSAVQKTDVPQPQAVTTDDLFDAMVEKMELSTAGENRFEVQLKPDFLGKVSIQLSFGENGLHAKISAEDHGVRSLINGQINQLVETLAEKGIKVAAMDVVYTGVADQSFGQNRPHQQTAGQAAGGKTVRIEGLSDAAFAVQTDSVLALDNGPASLDPAVSSVEYRA